MNCLYVKPRVLISDVGKFIVGVVEAMTNKISPQLVGKLENITGDNKSKGMLTRRLERQAAQPDRRSRCDQQSIRGEPSN